MRLPNAFNVQNSKMLMNSLKQVEVHPNVKVCSFDIKNMYTSIPRDKLNIIIHRSLTRNNVPNEHIHEITTLTKVVLNQNYFQYNNELYSQEEGLAMGAPTSSILADIYIQHLEHNGIIQILQNHHITDYYRYVDDIVYDETRTNVQNTLDEFNLVDPNIQYTAETQYNGKLNYLDITIIINNNTFTFAIYRKPTTTDTIIPNDSSHPTEHKVAAIRYMENRRTTYPISIEQKHNETHVINTILRNGYIPRIQPHKRKTSSNTTPKETRKWATFTYVGKEVRAITKLFKDTEVHVAYKTKNTTQHHLQTEKQERP
jgi:hypothetical protein